MKNFKLLSLVIFISSFFGFLCASDNNQALSKQQLDLAAQETLLHNVESIKSSNLSMHTKRDRVNAEISNHLIHDVYSAQDRQKGAQLLASIEKSNRCCTVLMGCALLSSCCCCCGCCNNYEMTEHYIEGPVLQHSYNNVTKVLAKMERG